MRTPSAKRIENWKRGYTLGYYHGAKAHPLDHGEPGPGEREWRDGYRRGFVAGRAQNEERQIEDMNAWLGGL